MKLNGLKYVVVIICLFSIMEKTGISAICFFAKIHLMVTDNQAAKQSNDTTERGEVKQAEIKEYWAVFTDHELAQPHIDAKQIKYYPGGANLHLSWYPPVATPPPNFQV